MQSILLQPWTTISATASGLLTFTQDEEAWSDLACYSDIGGFWIDVSQVTAPAGSNVLLAMQTSPSHDDAYFQPMMPSVTLGAASAPLFAKPMRLPSTAPLARWVRWQLTLSPNNAGAWGATFRIRAALSKQPLFQPTDIAGCALWLRADLGITLGTGMAVASWDDQGPSGDSNRNVSQSTPSQQPTLTPPDLNYNGNPTVKFISSSSTLLTSGLWSSRISQPTTWVVVGHNTATGPSFPSDFYLDGNDSGLAQSIQRQGGTSPKVELSAGTAFGGSSQWGVPPRCCARPIAPAATSSSTTSRRRSQRATREAMVWGV